MRFREHGAPSGDLCSFTRLYRSLSRDLCSLGLEFYPFNGGEEKLVPLLLKSMISINNFRILYVTESLYFLPWDFPAFRLFLQVYSLVWCKSTICLVSQITHYSQAPAWLFFLRENMLLVLFKEQLLNDYYFLQIISSLSSKSFLHKLIKCKRRHPSSI